MQKGIAQRGGGRTAMVTTGRNAMQFNAAIGANDGLCVSFQRLAVDAQSIQFRT